MHCSPHYPAFLTSLLFVILLTSSGCELQPVPDELRVLLNQVDAYNLADVDRLVDNVTEDFQWYSLTSDSLLQEVSGKAAFRESMINYFDGRDPVSSKISDYVIDGGRISFREVVSHNNADGEIVSSSALGIYEITDDKISRAWYFID